MKIQQFVTQVSLPVSAETAFTWHTRPGAFERLTPPWESVRILKRVGNGIEAGTRATFQTKIGPIWQTWVAEHTSYEEGREFIDEQKSGPFAHWRHSHRFKPETESSCILEDHIEYALPLGALGRILSNDFVHEKLSKMFRYRHAILRSDLMRHESVASQKARVIAISGSSGLIGSALAHFLSAGGHHVRRIVRRAPQSESEIEWKPEHNWMDAHALEGCDAVLHLAGENVSRGHWTDQQKQRIIESRVQSTRTLCDTIAQLKQPPKVLICASGVGFYGNPGEQVCDEASPQGDGFLAEVVHQWEQASMAATSLGVRVVNLRLGVVLSSVGGALATMLPLFSLGAGGRIGSGKQWFSWISLQDTIGVIHFALMNEAINGVMNAVSPNPVTNAQFSQTLGKVLQRPTWVPLPSWAVRVAFGEMGQEVLLNGQKVASKVLEQSGFRFDHPWLEQTIRFELGA